MATTDESLTTYLESTSWSVVGATAEHLPSGTSITVPRTSVLIYVSDGTIATMDPRTHRTVELDAHGGSYGEGAFIYTSGETPIAVLAESAARVVIVRIRPVVTSDAHDALPAALTVRDFGAKEPGVAALMQTMGREVDVKRASDTVVCARIVTVVMTTAIRTWVHCGCAPEHWLARAQDPYVARAIDAIHADPSAPWSVSSLAAVAMMGRSSFAERFRDLIGVPPLTYVTQVRIAAAQRHLGSPAVSVAEVAGLLGYASEEGFSRAFRRHTGQTPTLWREKALAS